MRHSHTIAKAFVALFLAVGSAAPASSLATQVWIEKPIPREYRDAAASMLRKIRPADAQNSLDSLKALIWPKEGSDEVAFIMRVEADCQGPYCMTLIGSMSGNDVKIEFTLQAGPMVHFGDVSNKLWGSTVAPSTMFETGGGSGLIMVPREQGWVLTACSNCSGRAMKPPSVPPKPAPKFDTFEEFRRALKDDGLKP